MNLAEQVLMISIRSMHITANEVTSITKFNEAEFTDAAFLKLLAKINVSFEKYEPDKAVMTYLHQHARTLKFELDFKNPKEYHNEVDPRSKERQPRSQGSASKKRARPQDDRTKRSNNKRHKSSRTEDDGTIKPVQEN